MTDKPIKATLDSSDDSVKTQKPILIQLDDIPTPTDADAGKVLGVDDEGKYELTEGGGGSLYMHNVQVGSKLVIPLIVDKAEPFTFPEFVAILYDLGYTQTKPYILPVIDSFTTINGGINVINGIYVATRTATVISVPYTKYTPTITDNQISYTSTQSNTTVSSITDFVFPCNLT